MTRARLWLRFEPSELQRFHCLPYSLFSPEVLPSRDFRLFVFLLLEGFLEHAENRIYVTKCPARPLADWYTGYTNC